VDARSSDERANIATYSSKDRALTRVRPMFGSPLGLRDADIPATWWPPLPKITTWVPPAVEPTLGLKPDTC
jgi:hypothetical protein